MKKWIMKWYEFMPYIAVFYALILGMFNWNIEKRALLLEIIFIHMHFYEEFGLPGGFAWGGIKVEMKKVNQDVSKWQLNQLSSFFGNEWFSFIVYLPTLFFPKIHWLILAAIIFAFIELLGHLVVFNIGLKSLYNPGELSAIILSIISVWYLIQTIPKGIFNWYDLFIALIWIGLNYWIAFRSPIFRYFNSKKQYSFSKVDLIKSKTYMNHFGIEPSDYYIN